MFKLTLCLALLMCSAVVGLHYSGRLKERCDTLNSVAVMLNTASIRVSYSSGDLCEVFSDNFAGYHFMRGEPFDGQWSSFVDSISRSLKKDDIILLKNFINGMGTTDIESEQRRIRLYTEQLSDRLSSAQRDMELKSKLYRTLPISAGLIISILVI